MSEELLEEKGARHEKLLGAFILIDLGRDPLFDRFSTILVCLSLPSLYLLSARLHLRVPAACCSLIIEQGQEATMLRLRQG